MLSKCSASLVLVVNARGEGEGENDIRVIVRLLVKAGVLRTVRLASYPIPYCGPSWCLYMSRELQQNSWCVSLKDGILSSTSTPLKASSILSTSSGIDDLANLTLLRRHAIVKVLAHISVKGVPMGTKYRGVMSAPKPGACRRGSMQMGCLGYSSLIAWFSFTTAFKSTGSPPLVRLSLQESLHSLRPDSPYTKPALCELMSTSIPCPASAFSDKG